MKANGKYYIFAPGVNKPLEVSKEEHERLREKRGLMTEAQALAHGYTEPRCLGTGEMAALSAQLFTTGLVVIDEYGVKKRWCFEKLEDAKWSLERWNGEGDPPGNWIKQKLPVEKMNPNWSKS